MSKTDINKYKSGKIYKILNTINDEVYVGSTYQKLSQRMAKHRYDVNNDEQRKCAIAQLMSQFGTSNFYIELIESCPCDNKEELSAREGYWIRQIGTLNKQIAGRTIQQYRDEHKERIAMQKKQYSEENRDNILANKRQYNQEHKESISARKGVKVSCPCGSVYSHGDKARHCKCAKHKAYEESLKQPN